jgi:holliday junction DNA helicase RuvA
VRIGYPLAVISRLSGILESVEEHSATLRVGGVVGGDLALEILLPAYVARELSVMEGKTITFHTLCYLEGQGQGTSFEPRLIGFLSPSDRKFFDLFTTVKGIGNKKALRALAERPATVAAAIARRDTRALTALPEIGKRLAETIIAELFGKVDAFLAGPAGAAIGTIEPLPSRLPPVVQDAIAALCALGETRPDAERKVQLAMERLNGAEIKTADTLIAAVYSGR